MDNMVIVRKVHNGNMGLRFVILVFRYEHQSQLARVLGLLDSADHRRRANFNESKFQLIAINLFGFSHGTHMRNHFRKS